MGHFTTISKSINNKLKGTYEYLKYLIDEKQHPNDKIYTFSNFDHKRFMKNLVQKEKKLIKLRKNQKKANKAKNYCQSFVFSLPPQNKDILFNHWQMIISRMIIDFEDILNTKELKYLEENIYINVHERKGKNSHINVVINKITENGLIDLSKKRFIYKLRTSFTKAVQEVLNINPPMTIKEKEEHKKTEEIKNLKKIINGQNKVIKKQISQNELIKWTLIFIQNAYKLKQQNESKAKIQNNLQKVKNNIKKIENEEQKEEFERILIQDFYEYSF